LVDYLARPQQLESLGKITVPSLNLHFNDGLKLYRVV